MSTLNTNISGKKLLQRRNNLPIPLHAGFDALCVILLSFMLTFTLGQLYTFAYMSMTLLLLVAMAVSYDHFHIYRKFNGFTAKAISLSKAWTAAFFILFLLGFLFKVTDYFSRIYITLLFTTGYLVQLAGHYLFLGIRSRQNSLGAQTKALVIGTGDLANHLCERINNNPWLPARVIGQIAITEPPGNTPEKEMHPPLIGNIADLNRIIATHEIRTVYIVPPLDEASIIKNIYFDLLDANLNIHWVPNIFALNLINHSVKEIAGLPVITLSESPMIGSNLLSKIIEDRLLSTLALIILSPIMLITALLIKLDSKGPVFFKQPRTGWDGKEFLIWKFRSMRVEQPENDGKIRQAEKNDPRITKIGRFIRKTSIDELPQLFNVLKGEMSLVGPRPHAVQHNQEYSKRITAYLARHRIKPGITGLAQVKGYRGETKELELMQKRVEYDLEYINNWSIGMDLSIMARTLFTLLNKNAY